MANCKNYSIILLNVVFAVAGIAIMVIGWMIKDLLPTNSSSSTYTMTSPVDLIMGLTGTGTNNGLLWGVIAVGFMIFSLAIKGLVSIYYRSNRMLVSYAIGLAAAGILEICLVVPASVLVNDFGLKNDKNADDREQLMKIALGIACTSAFLMMVASCMGCCLSKQFKEEEERRQLMRLQSALGGANVSVSSHATPQIV